MSTSPEPSVPKNSNLTRSTLQFPVVGIGASAGGLKALITLFESMPADCGMAFVVIMHLSPKHESTADRILQTVTRMPVLQVTQPTPIERNHIYVIPPALDLSMNDGYLRLTEPQRERGVQVAIELFFRTLADTHHTHAIGIVLSGSGADGSVGLSRIKEQGGITLAQEPGDAEFESMPRSAIETGMVDIVLPVADIAQKLVELHRNMQTLLEQFRPVPAPEDGEHPTVEPGEMDYIQAQPQTKPNELALREILAALRTRTGHDFRHYKLATVLRRIERRMQVNALPDMPSYARYLQGNPEETPALLADMLIGVTNFFRDREAFEALERDIIPVLFEQKLATDDRALRVWAAACSTGEEAYSLAMLLTDQAAHSGVDIQTQLFATDIDDRALETARAGVYPEAIVTDVTPGPTAPVRRQGSEPAAPAEGAARANPLRPPQHPARSAFLAARPDLLPQPDDLPGPRHPGRSAAHVPLRPQPRRLSVPRQLGDRRRLQPAVHPGRQEEPHLPSQGSGLLVASSAHRSAAGLFAHHPGAATLQRTAPAQPQVLLCRRASARTRAIRTAERDRQPGRRDRAHVRPRRKLPALCRRRALAEPDHPRAPAAAPGAAYRAVPGHPHRQERRGAARAAGA